MWVGVGCAGLLVCCCCCFCGMSPYYAKQMKRDAAEGEAKPARRAAARKSAERIEKLMGVEAGLAEFARSVPNPKCAASPCAGWQ